MASLAKQFALPQAVEIAARAPAIANGTHVWTRATRPRGPERSSAAGDTGEVARVHHNNAVTLSLPIRSTSSHRRAGRTRPPQSPASFVTFHKRDRRR